MVSFSRINPSSVQVIRGQRGGDSLKYEGRVFRCKKKRFFSKSLKTLFRVYVCEVPQCHKTIRRVCEENGNPIDQFYESDHVHLIPFDDGPSIDDECPEIHETPLDLPGINSSDFENEFQNFPPPPNRYEELETSSSSDYTDEENTPPLQLERNSFMSPLKIRNGRYVSFYLANPYLVDISKPSRRVVMELRFHEQNDSDMMEPIQLYLFKSTTPSRRFPVRFGWFGRDDYQQIDISFPVESSPQRELLGKISVEVRINIKNRETNMKHFEERMTWEDCFVIENSVNARHIHPENPLKRRRTEVDDRKCHSIGKVSKIYSFVPNSGPVDRQTNTSIIIGFHHHDYMSRFFSRPSSQPIILFGNRHAQFWGVQPIENVIETMKKDDRVENNGFYERQLDECERIGHCVVIRVQSPVGERSGSVDVRVVFPQTLLFLKDGFAYLDPPQSKEIESSLSSTVLEEEEEEEPRQQQHDNNVLFDDEDGGFLGLDDINNPTSPYFGDGDFSFLKKKEEHDEFGSSKLSFYIAQSRLNLIKEEFSSNNNKNLYSFYKNEVLKNDHLGVSPADVANYFMRSEIMEYLLTQTLSLDHVSQQLEILSLLLTKFERFMIDKFEQHLLPKLIKFSRSLGHTEVEEFLNTYNNNTSESPTMTDPNLRIDQQTGDILKIDGQTGDLYRLMSNINNDDEDGDDNNGGRIVKESNYCEIKVGFDFDFEKFIKLDKMRKIQEVIHEKVFLRSSSSSGDSDNNNNIKILNIESGSTYVTLRISGFQIPRMKKFLDLANERKDSFFGAELPSFGIEFLTVEDRDGGERRRSVLKYNKEESNEEEKIFFFKSIRTFQGDEEVEEEEEEECEGEESEEEEDVEKIRRLRIEMKKFETEEQLKKIRSGAWNGWSVSSDRKTVLMRNQKIGRVRAGNDNNWRITFEENGQYWVDVGNRKLFLWLVKLCYRRRKGIDVWVQPIRKNFGVLKMIQTSGNE